MTFFWQNFDTNLNKTIQIKFKRILKKTFARIFEEYFSKNNHLRGHRWLLLAHLHQVLELETSISHVRWIQLQKV